MNSTAITLGVARKFAPDIRKYIAHLGHNGVDAFEMGFAYGIPSRLEDDVLLAAKTARVALSCHLPFWINLGNEKREKNVDYLVAGLRIAHQMESIAVFHLGFYGGRPFCELLPAIVSLLREVGERAGPGPGRLGIETTGKQKALGTVDEVLVIITQMNDRRFVPVVDWAHLYARTNGSFPTDPDHVRDVLRRCNEAYPGVAYFHGGGIEFENGNETKHVSVTHGRPAVDVIVQGIVGAGCSQFTYIVESPDSIADVAWLRSMLSKKVGIANGRHDEH